MIKKIIGYGGSPYQLYKSPDFQDTMCTPTNPAKFKKGQRVQERCDSKAKYRRDFRNKERIRIEGNHKYKGGRKYIIVEEPYLSKPNRAGRRSWEYKILEDGKDKAIPKGQNMLIALEE
jgi:hypothetical protein